MNAEKKAAKSVLVRARQRPGLTEMKRTLCKYRKGILIALQKNEITGELPAADNLSFQVWELDNIHLHSHSR